MELKCGCGANLIRTGIFLDENDQKDLELVAEQENTAFQAISPNIINKIVIEDDVKLYEYMTAATDLLAKARFLKKRLFETFPKKYNISTNFDIVDLEFVIHEDTNEHLH